MRFFLLVGHALFPRSPTWPSLIGFIHLRNAQVAESDTVRKREALRARHWLEKWAQLASRRATGDLTSPRTRLSRAHQLTFIAQAALAAGNLKEADRLAHEVLRISPSAEEAGGSEESGDAESFIAHIVLGKVALAQGDVTNAEERLQAAASISPTVPAFATLGPDTALAQGLLAHGRVEAVIDYLEACRGFWVMGRNQLDDWVERIRQGQQPDLSAAVYDRKALFPLLRATLSRGDG